MPSPSRLKYTLSRVLHDSVAMFSGPASPLLMIASVALPPGYAPVCLVVAVLCALTTAWRMSMLLYDAEKPRLSFRMLRNKAPWYSTKAIYAPNGRWTSNDAWFRIEITNSGTSTIEDIRAKVHESQAEILTSGQIADHVTLHSGEKTFVTVLHLSGDPRRPLHPRSIIRKAMDGRVVALPDERQVRAFRLDVFAKNMPPIAIYLDPVIGRVAHQVEALHATAKGVDGFEVSCVCDVPEPYGFEYLSQFSKVRPSLVGRARAILGRPQKPADEEKPA